MEIRDYSFVISWTYFISLICFNLLTRHRYLQKTIFSLVSMIMLSVAVSRDYEMLNLNLLMNILPQVGLVTIVIVIISFSIHEFIDKVVMTAQKVCNANIELRSVL
jgi:hypothetical protein